MATWTNNNRTYYINPAYLTFNENSGYGANLIQVSASSSCYISVYDPESGIDYSDTDKNYRRWKVTAYNNKFPDNELHHIYVRLERGGSAALVVYDKTLRGIHGGVIVEEKDEQGNITKVEGEYDEENFPHYYILIGEAGETNGVTVRKLSYDTGYLETRKGESDSTSFSEMWELDRYSTPWLVKAKQWLADFTVKGFVKLVGGLVFKKGEIEKLVNDIKRSTDSDQEFLLDNEGNILLDEEENPIPNAAYMPDSDESIPTTMYLKKSTEKKFLRKDKDDRSKGKIASDKGFEVGKYVEGTLGSGASVFMRDGSSYGEVDYLKVRKKATFTNISVQELKHVGGEVILSPAAMVCVRVEEQYDGYRCYFNTEDSDGRKICQEFEVGDQARCQTFNLEKNVYYWRLVVAVGEDYIVLSRTDCDKNSDIPQAGDNISQLGNRTDKQRQAAIVLSAYGDDAPSYKQYNGIDSYSLEGKQVTKLSPFGNELTGKLNIEQGSTGWENIDGLPNSIQNAVDLANKAQETIDNTSVGAVNLLKNSGFTGDYQTEELSEKGIVGDENDMYSQNLLNWGANAEVIEETNAVSGYAVKIGSIEQTVNPLMVGEKYVLSCKAKGTSLTITCGSHTETFELKSSYAKAVSKFTFKGSKKLEISGDATLCDLQLERGTISTDWGTSPFDNDKAFAEFLGMSYIYDAIKNGSTSVLGGLILSNMIQLGKYKESNGQMTGETKAGISGIYNNDNDVAFWGGGTFEEAIKTVTKFKSDPRYKPTEEEWKGMANFVISHGGDAFFRGYVYALGGFFRGAVEIANGKIMLNQDGSGWLADKGIEWDKKGIMYRKATDVIRWTRPERNMIDFEDGSYFDISCQFKESPSTIELHSAPVDGYRICISLQKYRNYGSNILWGNFLILNPETKNLVDSFYISIYEWCTEEFWLTYHKSGNYWSLESSKYTITSEKTILGASNVVIFGESDKADSRSLVSEKKIKTPKIEVTGTDDESIKTDGGIKAVKLVLTGTEQKSKFLASPSGAEGSPSFRAIKEADIPEYKELKAKVADIEDSLSNIENNTGSNNSEIQALKTSVDSVKKQISTIEASITNLNTRVKNIEDLIEQ